VEQVSWEDCQGFLSRLQDKCGSLGTKFRLPREAEWEYACRAGSRTKYSFGDEEAKLGEYAWFGGNSGKSTHPVGQKKPNAWGLYDMHGNLWEWCEDWYGSEYYAVSAVDDPPGPDSGSGRVNRGGGWSSDAGLCRSADRIINLPGGRIINLGFRVARVAAE
jgi:formylglycine-generating enzyme required for sulfatase activity